MVQQLKYLLLSPTHKYLALFSRHYFFSLHFGRFLRLQHTCRSANFYLDITKLNFTYIALVLTEVVPSIHMMAEKHL